MKINLPALMFPAFLFSMPQPYLAASIPVATLAVLSNISVSQREQRTTMNEDTVAQKNAAQDLADKFSRRGA